MMNKSSESEHPCLKILDANVHKTCKFIHRYTHSFGTNKNNCKHKSHHQAKTIVGLYICKVNMYYLEDSREERNSILTSVYNN